MESTRKLGNPDEWLNQDRHHWNCGRFGLPEDVSIEEMIGTLQMQTRTLNEVFSHKILMYSYTHLMGQLRAVPDNQNLKDGAILRKYFPELRLVYIRRNDTVAQAVSLLKATQSAIWHHNKRTGTSSNPVHFSWTEIHSLIRDLKSQEKAWESLIKESELPCYRVLYEDLVRDRTGVINGLIRFSGIECEPVTKDFRKTVHKRTSDGINKAWKERYLNLSHCVRTASWRLHRSKKLRQAQIKVEPERIEVTRGDPFSLKVEVCNTSGVRWEEYGRLSGRGWIKVAAQLIDSSGEVLSSPSSWRELPGPVEPGESIEMVIDQLAVLEPGEHSVWVDLVVTEDKWFHEVSGCGQKVELQVHEDAKGRFLKSSFGKYEEKAAGSIYVSDWFGQFHLDDFPELYHFGLGYLKFRDVCLKEDLYVFESQYHGVLKTSSQEFPVMWSDKHQAFIRWHEGTHAPPRLSIKKNGEWVPLNFKKPGKALDEAACYFGLETVEGVVLETPWLGLLDVSEFPKVRHDVLGTVWCSGPGAQKDSYFFYSPQSGWFWTRPGTYPKLCRMDTKEWIEAEDIALTIF